MKHLKEGDIPGQKFDFPENDENRNPNSRLEKDSNSVVLTVKPLELGASSGEFRGSDSFAKDRCVLALGST